MNESQKAVWDEKVTVFDYKGESFKDKVSGEIVNYKYAIIRFKGRTVKVTTQVDLTSEIGNDVEVQMEVMADASLKPKIRINSIV